MLSATRSIGWLTENLDYPMFVVTAAAGGRRDGCLVGFTTQCSIEPMRYLVCLSRQNHTTDIAAHASHLGVHLLTEGTEGLAALFGAECGAETDKLARCEWSAGHDGTPLLAACPDRFVGKVIHRHDLGDHVGYVLELTETSSGAPAPPLGFQDLRHLEPGHPE